MLSFGPTDCVSRANYARPQTLFQTIVTVSIIALVLGSPSASCRLELSNVIPASTPAVVHVGEPG